MKQVLFPILDAVMILLMFFMMLVGQVTEKWVAAARDADAVPGMEKVIQGLREENGHLSNAKGGLEHENGILKGEKKALENKGEKLAHEKGGLENQLGTLNAEKQGLENENKHLADELGGTQKKLGQVNLKLSDMKSRFQSGAPVTLMIVVDITRSQQPNIDEHRSCLEAIFRTIPKSSIDFRVGILPFRDGLIKKNGKIVRFPITRILPKYEDASRSQDAALTFLASLRAEKSNTEHYSVFVEAISMIREAHPQAEPERRLRILFSGDTGPAELEGGLGYSPRERKVKQEILTGVKYWVRKGNRGVIAFYTENAFTQKDPGAAESRRWFQDLGNVSPHSEFYTSTSKLIIAINNASE